MYYFLFDDIKIMFTFLLMKDQNISAFHCRSFIFDTPRKIFVIRFE